MLPTRAAARLCLIGEINTQARRHAGMYAESASRCKDERACGPNLISTSSNPRHDHDHDHHRTAPGPPRARNKHALPPALLIHSRPPTKLPTPCTPPPPRPPLVGPCLPDFLLRPTLFLILTTHLPPPSHPPHCVSCIEWTRPHDRLQQHPPIFASSTSTCIFELAICSCRVRLQGS